MPDKQGEARRLVSLCFFTKTGYENRDGGDRMAVAVLDIGTSSMRGILYDDLGNKMFTEQVEYSPMYLEHEWVEQNPEDWKSAMEVVLKACTEYAEEKMHTIAAVSVTSQRSSVIPIGEDDTPVGQAIMWQDKRVIDMVKTLSTKNEHIFRLAGSKVNPVFSGIKMKWIREYNPGLYEKTKRFVVIPDYIIHEMTGEWKTDATYGSRSLLMNLKLRRWDDVLLDIFSVEKEKLCDIVEPGSIVGTVNAVCSKRTGLKTGTPVISAGGDQQCAALGMGIIRQGSAEISAGTGAYLLAATNSVPEALDFDVICNASAIPGNYVLEASIVSCASVFNWMVKLCYCMENRTKEELYQLVNDEMEKEEERESRILILPLFQGRGTPDWNSQARGCICNLNLGTSRGEMAKGVLEGVAYEIDVNFSTIQKYVGSVDTIYACGGILNSPVFRRILPSVLNRTVHTYSDNEATALGAWISAAVTLGLYGSYELAFVQARKGDSLLVDQPVPEKKEQYRSARTEYGTLYRKLYENDKLIDGGI